MIQISAVVMNFTSQTVLGSALAKRLERFRGKGAIIVCLQESSLLTCLTMARELRAWVFPLVFATVHAPDNPNEIIGAYDADGAFCPDPDGPAGVEDVSPQIVKAIDSQKAAALKSIHTQLEGYGMKLDVHKLDGRDAILAADVITDNLPLLVAQRYLSEASPKTVTAIVGNVAPSVEPLVRMAAGDVIVLDVLSGVISDETHYFEHQDPYSLDEKHTLTKHIAAYWQ